jgi:hypothetical protein
MIAEKGERRDNILAFVPRKAAAELAAKYGGDVNKETGLPQFGLFGSLGKLVGGGLGGLFGGGGGSNPGTNAYNELQTAAQPLLDSGKKDLAQYNSGQLKAGDQAALAGQVDAQKAGLAQVYGNMGLSNSTMLQNQLGSVDQYALTSRESILRSYLQSALSEYGTALDPLSQAISYQFQGAVNQQNAAAGLLSGIFGLLGNGGKGIGSLFGGGDTTSGARADALNAEGDEGGDISGAIAAEGG